MRIYTAANDTMHGHFERFRSFLAVFMPDAKLWVIPFDGNDSGIRRAVAEDPACRMAEAVPVTDLIGRRIFGDEDYRPGVAAWKYFRKLNAFFGHEEEFIFLDLNCLVLADLMRLFEGHGPGNGIYFGCRSRRDRSIRDEHGRRFLSDLSPGLDGGYNSAMMVSKGGAVDAGLASAIARPEMRRVIGAAPEQGFLAFYMAMFGVRHGTIAELRPELANITANVIFSDTGDGFVRAKTGPEAGKIKAVIKFPGPAVRASPPAVAQFFMRRAAQLHAPAGAA